MFLRQAFSAVVRSVSELPCGVGGFGQVKLRVVMPVWARSLDFGEILMGGVWDQWCLGGCGVFIVLLGDTGLGCNVIFGWVSFLDGVLGVGVGR